MPLLIVLGLVQSKGERGGGCEFRVMAVYFGPEDTLKIYIVSILTHRDQPLSKFTKIIGRTNISKLSKSRLYFLQDFWFRSENCPQIEWIEQLNSAIFSL